MGAEDNPADRTRLLPKTIGRFTVTRLLGRGGMGEVYLAQDPVLDRPVAIKLIGGGFDDEASRRRLVREARTAGRLHHPNIVTVFEAGEHDGHSYIAMEYVPGETLGSLIRRRAAVSLRRRLEMIEGACAGLAHAHREGVIHLDVKPDNLMLDHGGVVKVLDFGIARVAQSDTIATSHLAGTLRYMSPEQIQGTSLDHRSDVFSLGCALFEVLSYAQAFGGSTGEIVGRISMGPSPRLLDLSSRLDLGLDAIVSRALARDPAARYGDLDELRADLVQVRSRIDPVEDEPTALVLLGVADAPASPGNGTAGSRRPLHAARRWQRPAAVAATGAAVVVAAAVFLSPAAREVPASEGAAEPSAALPAAEPVRPGVVEQPGGLTGDEVWRRLARGDRAGVLEWLGTTGNDAAPAAAALAGSVVDTVRTTVLRARAEATTGGGSGTDAFRAAEDRLARASRLAARGDTVESLRAFWQAADLFARATGASNVSATAPPRETAVPAAPVPAEATKIAALPAPAPALVEAPQPSPPAPTPAAPTPGTPAAPPSPATAAVDRPVLAPQAGERPSDSQAILDTLRRYSAAYRALDVAALQSVYPSLGRDQVDQLRRTFAGVTAYEVDTRDVRIEVMEDAATVRATLARRMTPRVGQAVTNEVATEFKLRRTGGSWVIVALSAR